MQDALDGATGRILLVAVVIWFVAALIVQPTQYITLGFSGMTLPEAIFHGTIWGFLLIPELVFQGGLALLSAVL